MRYKLLGRSGMRVSELCLGTMTFGEDWGWGASKEDSQKVFDAFAEAGGNFIDTANRYTEGTSERFVGEMIAADRDHFVLATKFTLYTQHGDPNKSGNHRKNMTHALEASLKRLNTDYIDLYWLHAWDFSTPEEEVMRALDDLVRAGKVLHVAVSDTPAWVAARANTLAELRGWAQFVGYQVEYSLIERTIEREIVPMARQFNMPILAWGALSSGLLTGKYSQKNENGQTGRRGDYTPTAREQAIIDAVQQVADALGRSPSQVAINWTRQRPGQVIPILGARRLEQIQDTLKCLEFEIPEEHMGKLNTVSAIDMGFPMRFVTEDYIRNLIYGGTAEQIDGLPTFE